MNALPELVPSRSGVYRAPPDTSDLRARAAQIAASWFHIDVGPVRDKAGLLRVLAGALAFPPHFGGNWDALSDSLQDLAWLSARGYVLHLGNAEGARQALGSEWPTFLEVLNESAQYWKSRGKPFIVLIDTTRDLPPWL